jgi:beta-glucosidase
VTNTGGVDGDEVVQLYTRDPQASMTRPVLELKAFARVRVPAASFRTVTFRLHAGQLGFLDRQMRHVVEPGQIDVHIGTSAEQLTHAGSFEIATNAGAVVVEKVFDASAVISDVVEVTRQA